jgi:hypothetical protein
MRKRLKIVLTILAIALISLPLSHAQAPAQKPAFEVASVKPAPEGPSDRFWKIGFN